MFTLNSSSALKQTHEYVDHAITAISFHPDNKRHILSAEKLIKFDMCLKMFSSNSFNDDRWDVIIKASHHKSTLQFPMSLDFSDKQILKAVVLSNLLAYASCKQAKRIICDAQVVFGFLSSRNLVIENSRTATIDLFVSFLEGISKNDGQKNSIIRTYELLFSFCVENGYTDSNRIVDFSYRFKQDVRSKRAPDKIVSDAVTKLLFDLSYPMPLSYRCSLMILRLIPKRISEVLSMDVDCISYPADGVFAIKIATQKETDRHIPVVKKYNFQMSGTVEQIFYAVIKAQQKESLSEKAAPIDQNYLFFSREHKRVLSVADVNGFLSDLLEKNHICDREGNPAKMTTHDFRHVAIGERLRENIISPALTSIEANHSSIEQTIAYGYQSVHDEAEHLKSITTKVFDTEFSQKPTLNQELAPKKYSRVESQPYTRIIPCFGICTNQNCKPQFEQCVYCSNYSPNAEFLDYFQATKMFLENKIASLKEKHGDPKALEFGLRGIEAINHFIMLVEKKNRIERKEA